MRELRLVLLGLAALVALALGTASLMRAFKPAVPTTTSDVTTQPEPAPASGGGETPAEKAARGRLEQAIADAPDYARFFDRLRLVFPSDYTAIMNHVAASAGAEHEINVDKVMLEATRELRRVHGQLIAKSSDDALHQYFSLKSAEVAELGKRDPHLCVVFFGGEASNFLAFYAEHRQLVADVAIAGLDAMNSGRMDQVQRTVPTDDDLKALDHSLVDAGLSRPEISALLDDVSANPPIADERMCQAQQIYLQTMASMPGDTRARLLAFWVGLLAKS